MSTKRAKTLTMEQLNGLISYVHATSETPLRDTCILLFSFKAGLRAAEIAGLEWTDVCDVTGKVGQPNADGIIGFTVPNNIAKKGSGRFVPMHPALQVVLEHLKAQYQGRGRQSIIMSRWGGRITPNALQRYLSRVGVRFGLDGFSSHSGRRTFITQAVRSANAHGCSIRDVQIIAGHKDMETTEVYIEPSANAGKLVASL